jgi:pimeloyl-ACP methyl ester carboxylesterase
LQGAWQDISIGGKAAMCFEFPQTISPRGALLFLHDMDAVTLEASPIYTSLVEQHKFTCLCPRAPDSWWLDRVWPAFDPQLNAERWLIEQAVPFMQARWQLAPGRLAVLGLGMGGQGALRLALRHSELFQTVVGIDAIQDFHELYHQGTSLDKLYDSKEQCRQDTAILQIHPAHFPAHLFFCCDPASPSVLRGNDRLHEKLSALGIAHEIDFAVSAGGNSWLYAEKMAPRVMDFLARGIEEQSRRIL